MVPTLLPGDEFVVNTNALPRRGDIVAVEHPHRPDFWLVKRLVAVAGDDIAFNNQQRRLGNGEAWVLSDNAVGGATDSKTFGPVDAGAIFPVLRTLDQDTFRSAVELLTSEDSALAAIVNRHGVPEYWARPRGFRTMTILILEQQVSLESAAAVFNRLQGHIGTVTAATVSELTVADLNGIGFTKQKASYVLGLAREVLSGEVDFEELAGFETETARALLEKIRGIGRWTADAYLLAAEGRPDIFPIGDRALQVATADALGMDKPPKPAELEILSEPWKPIRSAAARLLWHDYLTRRGRAEPSHK